MQERLKILQHSLGLDDFGESKSRTPGGHRNHFCTEPGASDFEICRALVEDGLMREYPPSAISGGSSIFVVTPNGVDYVALNSPKRPPVPKMTRSQQRYQRFREYGDGFDNFLNYCRWDSSPERSWNGGAVS